MTPRLNHAELQAATIAELVVALEAARRMLVVAVIANSGGLFDHSNIGDHLGIQKIDAALARAGAGS